MHNDETARPNPVERAMAMMAASNQRLTAALQVSQHYRNTEVQAYHLLRRLAMRGDLEAFTALSALDHEKNPAAFDETVLREAPKWLARGGAL